MMSLWDQRIADRSKWFQNDIQSEDNGIFIVGCGRTGTTLLQVMLNRHSHIAGGPETAMFHRPLDMNRLAERWPLKLEQIKDIYSNSRSATCFAEKILRRLAADQGKKRWVEKTPKNVRVLAWLMRHFPNAKFIHMIRDGRDVVSSLRNHPRQTIKNSKTIKLDTNKPIAQCSRRWVSDTTAGLAFQNHPRLLEVRYEHLVKETKAELKRICGFLGEAYELELEINDVSQGMRDKQAQLWPNNLRSIEPVTQEAMGRWLKDLTKEERYVFNIIAGELLIALGYERNYDWIESEIGGGRSFSIEILSDAQFKQPEKVGEGDDQE